jgi:hypothetical protein
MRYENVEMVERPRPGQPIEVCNSAQALDRSCPPSGLLLPWDTAARCRRGEGARRSGHSARIFALRSAAGAGTADRRNGHFHPLAPPDSTAFRDAATRILCGNWAICLSAAASSENSTVEHGVRCLHPAVQGRRHLAVEDRVNSCCCTATHVVCLNKRLSHFVGGALSWHVYWLCGGHR